jgi:acyl transferase domain-containing protein
VSASDVIEPSLDIAVIGMSGRFPGAPDVETFWRNLCAGVESVQALERHRLLESGVDGALLDGGNYVAARAVLADIDRFDAAFFGYGPGEAASLDPQHRLFLECAWEAFEDAGLDPERAGSVGVYAGSSANGYLARALRDPGLVQSPAELGLLLGSDKDFLTTRVSYKLNLTGPSIAVQTACSTSLVAVHLACQALLNGECDMALAGGASIGVPQHVGYVYQADGIGSPDGHCRAFDAAARGTVAGSGVGVVLLERLDDARRRGSDILAVIKGTAINNDGRRKVGFTAPAIDGQVHVIRAAHAAANVDPDSITYVEAHGTGTPLGDPIEVSALTEAFGAGANRRAPCGLGSVKTNVGHLDAAAGITGLIKVVQALRHRQLPPSLHFESPNPNIDFERGPFRVVRELSSWSSDGPRRAAVSSFGLGGTNAHVVLEEAPAPMALERDVQAELLVLSARSAPALDALSAALAEQLEREPAGHLASVAQTLQLGRRSFSQRRSVVARDTSEAARLLRLSAPPPAQVGARSVVFLFPGQGVLRPEQCRELYASVPSFAADLDRCAELLRAPLGLDARALYFPEPAARELAEKRVLDTDIAQPLSFVLEYALARLWIALGLEPVACLGHSVGEWVCACLGGTCSLEVALGLMVSRGRFMQAAPEGGMLAVAAAEHELAPWLGDDVTLAASNAPRQSVLSGPVPAIEGVATALAAAGIAARRLPGKRAFHSAAMNDAARRFESELAGVRLAAPRVRWISNLTGRWISDAQACSPEYWAQQLREPVRFSEGLSTLLDEIPSPLLLEVGPGETLTQLCRQCASLEARPGSARVAGSHSASKTRLGSPTAAGAPGLPALALASLPSQAGGDRAALLTSVGRVWEAGVHLELAELWRDRPASRVHLPTTPFERQSYWLRPAQAASPAASSSQASSAAPSTGAGSANAAAPALEDWFYVPSWKRQPLLEVAPAASPRRWVLVAAPGDAQYERLIEQLAGGLAQKAAVTRCHGAEGLAPELASGEGAIGVLHASALATPVAAELDAPSFVAAQARGALDLLGALQAIGASSRPAHLVVLASGLCDITGDEVLRPEHAPLLGLCRSAIKEYPRLWCRVIDLLASADPQQAVARVLAEACSGGDASEPLVALRGGHRWLPSVTPIRLEPATSVPASSAFEARRDGAGVAGLRPRGVYMILGGLGGVGRLVAEWLAARVGARLVLVGRSAAADSDLLQAIERAGGEVMCVAADVTHAESLRAAVEAAERRYGTLHGVIHAAGVEGGGLIQRLSSETFSRELGPKVLGALLLDQVLANRCLDFTIYCSSLTALSGGVGQSAYAAANATLDALAQAAARGRGRRTLSIDLDRWQGVGMAARSAARLRGLGLDESGWQGMTPAEGIEVFARLCSRTLELPQVIVSRRVLDGLPGDDVFGGETALGDDAARATGRDVAESLASACVAPPSPTLVVAQVGQIWARVLGVPSVDPEQSFFEQGGESLVALAILNRVRDAFGTELSLREFFATPTVSGVAAQVARALPQPAAGSEPPLDAAPAAPAEPVLRPLPRSPRRYVASDAATHKPRRGDEE